MGKPKAPKAPDPTAVGAAQTSTNIGTAIANQSLKNVNQITPDGSLTFSQTGAHTYTDPSSGESYEIPNYTATQTLSPEQQAIADQNYRSSLNLATLGADQSGRLGGLLGRPQDTSSLPDRGAISDVRQTNLDRIGSGPELQTEIAPAGDITRTYGTDFSQDRQRVEDALFSRINPQLQRDQEALDSRLAAQGIRLGSEAYTAAQSDHSKRVNDARFGAVLNAGQEQSRLAGLEANRAGFENAAQAQAFGQNAAGAGFTNAARQQGFDNEARGIQFGNQASLSEANADLARFNAANAARGQALSEDFAVRNQPINEITALASGAQIQTPNFITPQTASIPTTDVAGIQFGAFNAANQQYNQERARHDALIGGLFGSASNLLYA